MMSAPGMVPVGPPMQHPGMPQPPPPMTLSQQQLQQQIEMKYDNVNKVKTLVFSLKDSFSNVMKVAGARINHMMVPGKTPEETPPRFDKTLEDFFSLCNQVEMHLKAIEECSVQKRASLQYTPLPVVLGRQDATQDGNSLSYAQYVSTLKAQVAFAKDTQHILQEGVRNIAKADSTQGTSATKEN